MSRKLKKKNRKKQKQVKRQGGQGAQRKEQGRKKAHQNLRVDGQTKQKAKEDKKPQKKESPAPPSKSFLKAVALASSLFLILLGGYLGVRAALVGKAMPGTQIAGVKIGLMEKDEIKSVLRQKLLSYSTRPITVLVDGKSRDFSFAELSILVDMERTLGQIRFVDHGVDDFEIIKGAYHGKSLGMVVDFQHERIRGLLDEAFALEQRGASNATVRLNEKAEVEIVPEKAGEKMEYEKFIAELGKNLDAFSSEPMVLAFVPEIPTVTALDLENQREQLERRIAQKVILKSGGQKWTLGLKDRLDWVKFERKDGHRLTASADPIKDVTFEIDLNREVVANYLAQEVVKDVEEPIEAVKIYHNDKGKIVFEGRPKNGLILEIDETVDRMIKAINEEEEVVELPIKEIRAPVETDEKLKVLGISKLISIGHTTFFGSPANRIHNIAVGINKYNGLMIAPGEQFSFNSHLGPVDGKHGYRQELVIKGDETIPEFGGGLCQVSTTFYRAALFAGLPILKRAPHSYAVSYYSQVMGHGLDATVYPDAGKDVIIENNTPGHILIQSYSEGGHAYYMFYGSDDGREVKMEGPYISNHRGMGATVVEETDTLAPGQKKQTERGHNGFDASWYRIIKNGDKEEKEMIFSGYRAVPPKILVGKKPEAEGADGNFEAAEGVSGA